MVTEDIVHNPEDLGPAEAVSTPIRSREIA